MDLYERNGNILYILNVLKKYSDEEHMLSVAEIQRKVKEIYGETIDSRTIRRNINLLKYKLDYDISTRDENNKGYYFLRNPETDFEPGEIRAIIDTFSYANYIVPSISENIVNKCKNMQNIYENQKLVNYKTYAKDTKTDNMEVIKNIEDITDSISSKKKIKFEYWKYEITTDLEKVIVSTPTVSPYAIVYDKQQFYLIGIKDGKDEFYHFRLDRMKNLQKLNTAISIFKTDEEINEYSESTVEMYGGHQEEIEAFCPNYLLETVIDVFGKNVTIKRHNKEKFKLILKANATGFKIWALKNLDCVEVLKPAHLREDIKNVIKEAYKRYE